MPIRNRDMAKPSGEYWSKVFIGLGGNVGDVVASMVEALNALEQNKAIRVIKRSALYATPPWGDLNQDDFINACALLETTLMPQELLGVLKSQEKTLKRETTRRWGPRTIDLDILLIDTVEMKTRLLEIPHPRMTGRGFVLMPLNDLDFEITIQGKAITQWLIETDLTGIQKLEDQSGWVSGQTINSEDV